MASNSSERKFQVLFTRFGYAFTARAVFVKSGAVVTVKGCEFVGDERVTAPRRRSRSRDCSEAKTNCGHGRTSPIGILCPGAHSSGAISL